MNKNNIDDENNERMINLFFGFKLCILLCYRFELPALMSGTHRATGFYLSGGKIVIIN